MEFVIAGLLTLIVLIALDADEIIKFIDDKKNAKHNKAIEQENLRKEEFDRIIRLTSLKD